MTRLRVDDLPELDTAVKALDEGDQGHGLLSYLQALMKATVLEEGEDENAGDTKRLWLHVRLSRFHNARDEYVPAAGHAAAVFAIEPHASWRVLEPACAPSEPTFAQAVEADDLLREAARQVKDQTLRETIDRMSKVVQPIRAELEKNYNGPPIAQNSTWSGYSRARIADGTIFADAAKPSADSSAKSIAQAPQPNVTDKSNGPAGDSTAREDASEAGGVVAASPAQVDSKQPPNRTNDVKTIDRAADEIDALLKAGEFAEALNRCESAGRDVTGRDIGRLLHQWGRALIGVGRPEDAAVMFTRCAVLFPGSASGLECLIETAMLYETVYKKPETAQRLLRRVIEQADMLGRESIAQRARGLLRN